MWMLIESGSETGAFDEINREVDAIPLRNDDKTWLHIDNKSRFSFLHNIIYLYQFYMIEIIIKNIENTT